MDNVDQVETLACFVLHLECISPANWVIPLCGAYICAPGCICMGDLNSASFSLSTSIDIKVKTTIEVTGYRFCAYTELRNPSYFSLL
jgi:hypothetical protein